MSLAVVRRGLIDGWRGLAIAAAAVSAMLVLGLVVYQDIDLSIYEALPDAVRSIMGIPDDADASVLAYNEMLASIGAMALVGVAVAIGAHAVAGEEANRTLHVTLGAPVSRVSFAVSKALAMAVLIVAATALVWGAAVIAPVVLGIDIGDAKLGSLMTHLGAAALFHGSLAFAVGAATGRKALAAGAGAAVMVLGWLGAGLLPMWREGAADWIPWTWFNGTKPLVNGIDGAHLGLLVGGALVLLLLGVAAFVRRELRLHEGGASMIQRIRALPGASRLLRPTTRGGSLLGLRLASQRTLLIVVALIMGPVMGLAMGPLYAAMEEDLAGFAQSFPESMVAMFGGGDMTTATGFLHIETMGMMAPIAVILVATAAATAGIAGEERAGRLAGLLAQPQSRGRVYCTTAAATAISVVVIAAVLFLGLWAGIELGGLDVNLAYLVAACILLVCLGWCFGGLALLLSGATGKPGVAVWGTVGVAVVTYFGYTLLMAASKEPWGWWSPFRAYLYGPPLEHGIEWWQPVTLLVAAGVLTLAGAVAFTRRDLR